MTFKLCGARGLCRASWRVTDVLCRYTQSAEQGNAQAQNSLAYCYRYGHGVKADKAKAASLCAAPSFRDRARW